MGHVDYWFDGQAEWKRFSVFDAATGEEIGKCQIDLHNWHKGWTCDEDVQALFDPDLGGFPFIYSDARSFKAEITRVLRRNRYSIHKSIVQGGGE